MIRRSRKKDTVVESSQNAEKDVKNQGDFQKKTKGLLNCLGKMKSNSVQKCKSSEQDPEFFSIKSKLPSKVTGIQLRQKIFFFKRYDFYRRRVGLVASNAHKVQARMVKRTKSNFQRKNKTWKSVTLAYDTGNEEPLRQRSYTMPY